MDTTSSIVAFAVSLTMALLISTSLKLPKEDEQGNKILVLPKFYLIIGLFSICVSLAVVIAGTFTANQDEIIFVILIATLFLSLGIPLFLIGKNFKLVITTKELIHTNIFGKTKSIKWEEIKSISFGKISLELKIKTDLVKIKIHQHSVGFPYLIDTIESKTNYTKKSMRIPF
jgi:hypothetical protein